MWNAIETFGGILLFLAVGFMFLWVFASLISGGGRQSMYQQLQSLYSTRQLTRRDERQEILEQIGAPRCPDGTYDRNQQYLWNKYHELERIDKQLTRQERNQLVEASGYLPDEIADIIEGEK